jgi:hypothetical protein
LQQLPPQPRYQQQYQHPPPKQFKPFQALEIPSLTPVQKVSIRPPPPPPPKLRRDPVLDSKEEIARWLEQRRKRFPRTGRTPDASEVNEAELSKLELKLRKKVRMMSGSSKRLHVKIKQMKELFQQLTGGYKPRKRVQPTPVVEERKASNDFNIDDYFVREEVVQQETPPIQDEIATIE